MNVDAPRTPTRSEQALRNAMDRLFAGQPQRTDGRLIKNNLFKEAGVSRATMNRATSILADWDAQINAQPNHNTTTTAQDQLISKLRSDLAKVKEHNRFIQHQLDAATTAIGALHADNSTLRSQLTARTASVIPLDRARANRE